MNRKMFIHVTFYTEMPTFIFRVCFGAFNGIHLLESFICQFQSSIPERERERKLILNERGVSWLAKLLCIQQTKKIQKEQQKKNPSEVWREKINLYMKLQLNLKN